MTIYSNICTWFWVHKLRDDLQVWMDVVFEEISSCMLYIFEKSIIFCLSWSTLLPGPDFCILFYGDVDCFKLTIWRTSIKSGTCTSEFYGVIFFQICSCPCLGISSSATLETMQGSWTLLLLSFVVDSFLLCPILDKSAPFYSLASADKFYMLSRSGQGSSLVVVHGSYI